MLKRAEVPDAHWKQADEEGRQSQPQLQENEVPMQKLLSSLHNANKTKTNRKVRTHAMQDFEALSSIALAAFSSPLFSHPPCFRTGLEVWFNFSSLSKPPALTAPKWHRPELAEAVNLPKKRNQERRSSKPTSPMGEDHTTSLRDPGQRSGDSIRNRRCCQHDNGLPWLICLNTCSPVGETAWEGIIGGGVALGWTLGLQTPMSFSVPVSVSASYLLSAVPATKPWIPNHGL